jgi:lantibiotic modifying enzyme
MHHVTGEQRWLDSARRACRHHAAARGASGGGIKIPSFADPAGVPVCYTGLSHGSAGAGYFLCRLAQALPAAQHGAPYAEAANAIATWLDGLAVGRVDGGVQWYRREPDQVTQFQATWCHGPPGIGIFYAELHRISGSAAHLDMAARCALTTEAGAAAFVNASQCHGLAGNAQLLLKLFRSTGDPAWLQRARRFGELAWSRRIVPSHYPAWRAGDGTGVDNPGLMTGTSGVGWFYLQLAGDGTLPMPVTA